MKNRKDTNINAKKGEIVIYKAKSGSIRLDVKLENETVWFDRKDLYRRSFSAYCNERSAREGYDDKDNNEFAKRLKSNA